MGIPASFEIFLSWSVKLLEGQRKVSSERFLLPQQTLTSLKPENSGSLLQRASFTLMLQIKPIYLQKSLRVQLQMFRFFTEHLELREVLVLEEPPRALMVDLPGHGGPPGPTGRLRLLQIRVWSGRTFRF